MKQKTFTIAGGNTTLIVWNCAENTQKTIVQENLNKVEQIGFASVKQGKIPRFTMMGNEFSGNGTLAFASTLLASGYLKTSGINKRIRYINKNGETSITVPLQFSRKKNIILLEGIGYFCTKKQINITKEFLKGLAMKYNLPAFGIAVCVKRKLIPYVFVQQTDSLCQETACGSGSIAASIFTGNANIMQPTGEVILVKKNKKSFRITAKTRIIR